MSSEPLVSILMNCYNGERYLRPALDSVLAQTYQNWELIFWDNQSTDESESICKGFRDSRIRYFFAKEHTELGVARIHAFRQIRGDFVAILDADDVSHPNRLERQVAFLKKNPDVALVGSWAQQINEYGRTLGEFKSPVNQEELRDCLGWTNPIVHSSTMYRHRSALEAGGYSNDFIHASDFNLLLTLAQRFKIAVIADFLCQLRLLPTSMSRSKKTRAIAAYESLILFQRVADLLPLSMKARRLNRRAQAIAKIKFEIFNLSDGPVLPGMKLILQTLLSKPSVLWGNGPVRRFFGKPF